MLKALELIGFKSFADKTRFEFPPGITVVVGPNGSGKSNIVDAIKWVLGEQSVKSLRGKEMVDVIFNGAAGRKPMNMAEVTLVFDNRDRRLDPELAEVAVTRRVYRSGEGEYLINRQACRLRDIRDLFAGTGVATEAYSVIEQGKVDVLLQSSPKDRRLIFEEAAGISRFKAKKLECQRRLERVDQNLLRLSDIVDEVESRLKSVRLQATKARRYQEFAERLQSLRTSVAAADWRALTAQIEALQNESVELKSEIEAANQATILDERRNAELDREVLEIEALLRSGEQRLNHNHEKILSLEAHVELDRGRVHDLNELLSRYRRQGVSVASRAGNLEATIVETAAALETANSNQREFGRRLADEERALTDLNRQADALRAENEQLRGEQLEHMRRAAALGNEITALDAQLVRSEERRERCLKRLAEVETQRTETVALLERAIVERTDSTSAAHAVQERLNLARTTLHTAREAAVQAQRDVSREREYESRLNERAAILEEWEQRLEGVSAGVKCILESAQSAPAGPLSAVRGMLADLLQTGVEHAPILEALLADQSQTLVYEATPEMAGFLAAPAQPWHGRVTFLPLGQFDSPGLAGIEDSVLLAERPGVLGRVDRWIETSDEMRPLVERLLSNTWLVQDLGTAVELHGQWPATANRAMRPVESNAADSTLRLSLTGTTQSPAFVDDARLAGERLPPTFVTRAGEVVWPNGAMTVGTQSAGGGLISRRSELRALRTELASHRTKLTEFAGLLANAEAAVAAGEIETGSLAAEHQRLLDRLAETRTQVGAAEQRRLQLDEQYRTLANDAGLVAEQSQAAIQNRAQARNRFEQLQSTQAVLDSRIKENARRLEQLEEARQSRNRDAMSVKVELARSEQQVENLGRQLRQFEQDRHERQRSLRELGEQISASTARIVAAEDAILSAEQQLAELYLRKEAFVGETVELSARREAQRIERAAIAAESNRVRQKIRKVEEKLHRKELSCEGIRHERTALAERMREDYAIDLAALEHDARQPQSDAEARERATVDDEINDLRRKLANLGGVNLEALQEADELEARFENLGAQFQDLSKGKQALEQIIHKINADSRRLFIETLEQVKEHFQTLFRKLFGGGRADIILEENVDILESGIEIVARPPGKEPRNISLLSGGEKTMTCVALLLSIFRSRPSPFCVLDEVDAALDEANIERFVGVLNEFLNWTQFIVVTHSKKTMTCGTTLYGVTMQESGISKRVSVRFEDVSEDGHIRINPALQNNEDVESDAA